MPAMHEAPTLIFDTCSLMRLSSEIPRGLYARNLKKKPCLQLATEMVRADIISNILIPDVVLYEMTGIIEGAQTNSFRFYNNIATKRSMAAMDALLNEARDCKLEHRIKVIDTGFGPFNDLKACLDKYGKSEQFSREVAGFVNRNYGERAVKQYVAERFKLDSDVYFVSDDKAALSEIADLEGFSGRSAKVLTTADFLYASILSKQVKEQLALKKTAEGQQIVSGLNRMCHTNLKMLSDILPDREDSKDLQRLVKMHNRDLARNKPRNISVAEDGLKLNPAEPPPSQMQKFSEKYKRVERRTAPKLGDASAQR